MPNSTPASALVPETRAIASVLNRYEQAFSALDANAAHDVWPSVNVKALGRAFDQLDEQTFALEGCNINVAGARAEAECAGNARYIRKVGKRDLRVEPRHWHFRLRQLDDQWVIDEVDAR
jgi:Zn finger protein HypA/HybF involved in hydrogenase expression